MDANELKRIGKKGIIEVALKELQHSGILDMSTFKIEDFEVKVMASDKNVRVVFKMVPIYIPLNSCFCYGMDLNLTDGSSTYNIISNPDEFDRFDNVPLFTPTRKTRKAVAFIKKVVTKAYPEAKTLKGYMIYEKDDFYEVMISSGHTDGGYRIDKGSGSIYDDWHKHRIPQPDYLDDEVYEEIK